MKPEDLEKNAVLVNAGNIEFNEICGKPLDEFKNEFTKLVSAITVDRLEGSVFVSISAGCETEDDYHPPELSVFYYRPMTEAELAQKKRIADDWGAHLKNQRRQQYLELKKEFEAE